MRPCAAESPGPQSALRLGALIAPAERLGTPSRTRAALRARRALTALGALGALEIALGQDFLIRTYVRTYVRKCDAESAGPESCQLSSCQLRAPRALSRAPRAPRAVSTLGALSAARVREGAPSLSARTMRAPSLSAKRAGVFIESPQPVFIESPTYVRT